MLDTATHRRRASWLLVLLLPCSVFQPGCAHLQAYPASDLVSISPRRGYPGETITIRATNLPASSDVELKVGSPRFGYRTFAYAQSDSNGRLEAVVRVPPGVSPGSSVVFAISSGDSDSNSHALYSYPFAVR